jgi:hypothetical protein
MAEPTKAYASLDRQKPLDLELLIGMEWVILSAWRGGIEKRDLGPRFSVIENGSHR